MDLFMLDRADRSSDVDVPSPKVHAQERVPRRRR